MWSLLMLLACPRPPMAEVHTGAPEAVQFAIRSPYGTLAGSGLVQTRPEGVEMHALTPVGLEIFRVRALGDELEVHAADPAWESALARLPWRRDLGLLHQWGCEEVCRTPSGGTLRRTSDSELRYRGPGGPATVHTEGARVEVHDALRHYTLVVIHGP